MSVKTKIPISIKTQQVNKLASVKSTANSSQLYLLYLQPCANSRPSLELQLWISQWIWRGTASVLRWGRGSLSACELGQGGQGECAGKYGACKWRLAVSWRAAGGSAFMEQVRGMCGSAQLPCFVIVVHCAVCLSNIKLPVLCVHVQDLPWICTNQREWSFTGSS